MDDRLFDVGPDAHPSKLSRDQRLTLRRNAILADGRHPTTKLSLRLPVGEHRCGDCGHRRLQGGTARDYHKCGAAPLTGGPATDVRVGWPACVKWIPEETDGG